MNSTKTTIFLLLLLFIPIFGDAAPRDLRDDQEKAKNFSKPEYYYQIKNKYDFIDWTVKDGLILVIRKGRYGCINEKGIEIVPPKYDSVYPFNKRVARIELNGKWGLLDIIAGKEIIPPQYERTYSFKEGFAAVRLNGKWGYIDIAGNDITPLKYEAALEFEKEGVAAIKLNGKWGYIDRTGKEIIPPKYTSTTFLKNGKIEALLDDYIYIINAAGKVLGRRPTSEFVKKVKKDAERVKNNFANPEYYYQARGKYEYIDPYLRNGLILVRQNEKYGYIDKTGKEVIPPRFDGIGGAFHDRFVIKLGEKYGLIDSSEKEIIPTKYDGINLSTPCVIVKIGGKYGLVDYTGKEIISPRYDDIGGYAPPSDTFGIKLGEKYGLIKSSGKVIIPPEYDFLSISSSNVIVRAHGRQWLFDYTGKKIREVPVED